MEILYNILAYIWPVFIYLFQLAITIAIIFVLTFIPYFLIKSFVNSAYIISIILSATLVLGSIFYLTYNPIIIANDTQKEFITPEVRQEIYDNSAGFASLTMPIYPVYVKIDSINSKTVRFNTKYMYFGTSTSEIVYGVSSNITYNFF